jgi:2-methylcitrate dehydratase PrpD
MTPTTELLARFVTSTSVDALPAVTLERASMSIASTIASAAMGHDIESSRIIRDIEIDNGGKAQSSVWFESARLPAAHAARINAVASDAAASDDSDLRSIAHIGTVVSSSSVAMGEALGRTGREVLHAMVLGYEVAGRVDEALTPIRGQRGFHGCISTIFGGAVAAGTLLRLNTQQMTYAIATAATSIGGIYIAANTSWAREYHAGLSAMLGINAALAASRGFITEPVVLDGPKGFFALFGGQALEDVTRDFGQSWDIATDMAIKLMPGAHPYHAIAEAAIDAATEGNVNPADVAQIMISAAQHSNWHGPTHPTDLIGVAHSIVYFVAACVADRKFSWEHVTQEKINDPVIRGLLDKVVFDPNPTPLPDRFPHRHGGTVIITMKNGQKFSNTCKAPRGSGPRGVEWADVDAKYRHLLPLSGLPGERIEESLRTIHGLVDLPSITTLTNQLRK